MDTKQSLSALLARTNPGSPDSKLGSMKTAELLTELKRRRDEGSVRFDTVTYVSEEEIPYKPQSAKTDLS